jgi:hypothetical protein
MSNLHDLKREIMDTITEQDFICTSMESLDISDLSVEKNKKIFDIRKSGKRLWIKCDNVTVKYGYSMNQYKSVDTKEGTFVLHVNESLRNLINVIDQYVMNEFCKMYRNTILNNIMITQGTISTMFRSSLYNDTLRLYISPLSCAIFRTDQSKIEEPDMENIIREDLSLAVIIEPAFAWMMNQKIGIHWDCRQVKLCHDRRILDKSKQKQKNAIENKKNKFSMLSILQDDDDSDNNEDNEQTNKQMFIQRTKKHIQLIPKEKRKTCVIQFDSDDE